MICFQSKPAYIPEYGIRVTLPYKERSCFVFTTIPAILEFLKVLYTGYVDYSYEKSDFCIYIRKSNDAFLITTKDGLCYTKYPQRIVADIINRVSRTKENFLVLHGMAFSYNNQTVLSLGHTHTGKSTLSCFFLYKQYEVLTDDLIVLDRDSLSILPLKTPIKLRKKGIDVLPYSFREQYDCFYVENGLDECFYINKPLLSEKNRRINRVFFSQYGDSNYYKPIYSSKEIIERLLFSVKDCGFLKKPLTPFSALSNLKTYELGYNSLEYALNVMTKEGEVF